jgi:hypothetical protein
MSIVGYLCLVFAAGCVFGAIASLWLSQADACNATWVRPNAGRGRIYQEVPRLHVRYTAIAKFAIPLTVLIVVSYQFRPESSRQGRQSVAKYHVAVVAALGFIFGIRRRRCRDMYPCGWRHNQLSGSFCRPACALWAGIILLSGGTFSAVLNLTLCCITG